MTRSRGLPYSARAGKKISVVQPPVLNRVAQGAGQDFLAGYIFEFLRAPLARDYLISHRNPIYEP
jgi:hypothetical protein